MYAQSLISLCKQLIKHVIIKGPLCTNQLANDVCCFQDVFTVSKANFNNMVIYMYMHKL